eukprot:scaffold108672_cov69-Phaeocystis_antarctica.AAC.1
MEQHLEHLKGVLTQQGEGRGKITRRNSSTTSYTVEAMPHEGGQPIGDVVAVAQYEQLGQRATHQPQHLQHAVHTRIWCTCTCVYDAHAHAVMQPR